MVLWYFIKLLSFYAFIASSKLYVGNERRLLQLVSGEYLAAMYYCFAWVMGTRIEVWLPNVDVAAEFFSPPNLGA
jgi:hypothetical protein